MSLIKWINKMDYFYYHNFIFYLKILKKRYHIDNSIKIKNRKTSLIKWIIG